MHKLIELPKDNTIQISNNILNFDKPDKVYFKVSKDSKIFVNLNDAVSIGTPLIKTPTMLVTSPISGKINDLKIMHTINNETKFLEIINNYKEKTIIEPKIAKSATNIKKDILDKLLRINFNLDMTNKKNLVLNCLDDEPYILTENFYLFLYYEGFLALLDSLAKIYNYETITICVKSSSSENINKLMECLGMYPNINLRVVPNLYPIGNEQLLLDYLEFNDPETLILKASFFYHIYNLIERNRQMSDKLITISGNGLKNPSIIKVKIGSKLEDVLNSFVELNDDLDNLDFIVNGLMSGKILTKGKLKDFVISLDFNGLLIMKKKKQTKKGKCLNCGACLSICPVNINPLLFKNKKYLEKIEDKCLKCGLCSYICPVYINFNKYLKGDNNE